MIRKLTISLFIALLTHTSYGQGQVDSLRQALQKQKEDTLKVQTYLQFFYSDLFYSNPQEVIDFLKKSANLSQKLGYAKGIAEAYNSLGYMYRIRSENDSAFHYFNEALIISQESEYTQGLLDAFIGLGNTNNQIGNWKEALVQFKNAEEVAERTKNDRIVASANNNMGNISLARGALSDALKYYQKAAEKGPPTIREVALINIALVHIELKNFIKAREYFQQAIKMSEKAGTKYNLAFIYEHLGSVEQMDGNSAKAIDYYNEAITLFESIDERYNVSDLQTNLADIYFESGDYNKALEMYRTSFAIQEEIDHFVGQCNNLLGIGKTLMATGDFQESEVALLDANQIADKHQLLTAKDNIVLSLSTLYKEMGNYQKALDYHIQYKILSDSLLNQENSKQINELETQYQTVQKEQEIDLLSAENQIANLQIQKQQNLRNYLLIIAVILVVLIGVVYNQYSIKAKANNRLKELDQLKTSFFTNISHEFRTPLSLILSPLQKLLQADHSGETQKELSLIQRNATRLLELINQLLDLSKLEAGKLELKVRKGNIREFMEIAAASFESLAVAQMIHFHSNLNQLPKAAYFDEDKVQKIITNLLSNAFKFTPSKGNVSLNTTFENGQLLIAISDTGPGIEPSELKNIFHRFHQSTTTNPNAAGTGIGLTLTKELATLHHGKIEVESTLGKGSTFTFSFPTNKSAYASFEIAESEAAKTIVLPTNQSEIAGSSSEKEMLETDTPAVLVVEDNADLRLHISSLLQEHYIVHESVNGREGINDALKFVPDIIISDLMMPEADGITLCNELKVNEKTSHIPIVLLTAKADKETKLEGLTTGADEYLTKPFDNDELLIRVENLIKSRSALKQKFSQTLKLEPSQIEVNSPDEAFIRRAMEIVDQHLSDETFTVEAFQKEMGMSRMQLHRKLKALTNFSASEFTRDLRLQRAATLLSNGQMNVAETAYSCGFNSLSYFTECFKEKFGSTPSKYAKKAS